jgi:DNA adenine methylase
MRSLSPLRYPGGKASLSPLIKKVLFANHLQGGTYVEPFAGGAAVALNLLFDEHVEEILINDFDPRVFAFWKSILNQNTRFQEMLEKRPVTIEEWNIQRQIYLNPLEHSTVKVGFAAFFLNRCNRSGIMVNGGPIGGKLQTGTWKIDARFNREKLSSRISEIHDRRSQIEVTNSDCVDLLDQIEQRYAGQKALVYLDPPYFKQGPGLYFNSFDSKAHETLSERMKTFRLPWVMTYDAVPEVSRLYEWANSRQYGLRYSAYEQRRGGELLIWPDHVSMPEMYEREGVIFADAPLSKASA